MPFYWYYYCSCIGPYIFGCDGIPPLQLVITGLYLKGKLHRFMIKNRGRNPKWSQLPNYSSTRTKIRNGNFGFHVGNYRRPFRSPRSFPDLCHPMRLCTRDVRNRETTKQEHIGTNSFFDSFRNFIVVIYERLDLPRAGTIPHVS